MPTSTSGISYDEINPSGQGTSPREDYRSDGTFVASRWLKCDWSDRLQLIADLGEDGGEVYPNEPDVNARAVAAKVVGRGVTTPVADVLTHTFAIIEFTYAWSPTQPVWINDNLVTEIIRGGSEYQRIDPERLVWDDGGGNKTPLLTNEAPSVPWGFLDYTVTYYGLVSEAEVHYTGLNTVNANTVTPYTLAIAFPVGTLSYQHPFVRRSLSLGGVSKVDVSLTYRYRPQGWNVWFRTSVSAFRPVYDSVTNERFMPYTPIDY